MLALEEQSYTYDEDTDLILHFDQPRQLIGSYSVEDDPAHYSGEKRVFGTASALFRSSPESLQLLPREGSLFAPGTLWNDFTIEFWLRPQYLSHGEEILSWKSNRLIGDRMEAQELQVSIAKRNVQWSFQNIFFSPQGNALPIRIRGRRSLVPESWHHFSIRFDAATGMLLFQIDGIDEAVEYITSTGKEGGSVYLPLIGGTAPEPLSIAAAYTGYIDELRFSSSFREDIHLKPYPLRSGIAETLPLDLEGKHTRVVAINIDEKTPGGSEIYYSYRRGDEKTDRTSLSGPWIPFSPSQGFDTEMRGRYIQLRFELFPDGSGLLSPSISKAVVVYEKDSPPVPPSLIELQEGEGTIEISWNSVSAHDLSGYLLFFGTEPGIYRGTAATESPVDTGEATSFKLEGLENGKLYFFRIAAYDNNDPDNRGPLSREVHGRPRKGNETD